MDLYNLVSIVASQKKSFQMKAETVQFRIAPKRSDPYIEPTFTKVEYPGERPTVILVSAVGATGKTTLAQVLSNRTGLPLLDLAKLKPVGENTLTGLLTTGFHVEQLSAIFESLAKGNYGVIIDGVDEGRSKTTEKGFHAFLDDLARLCTPGASTTFVLLGRTQTLEECWMYLTDKVAEVALLSIDPFTLNSARQYIDQFTGGNASPYAVQYKEVRDEILDTLSAAFSGQSAANSDFAAFIGYPPVLDAIVTLLPKETNYHRIKGQLRPSASGEMEADLLLQIGTCITEREKQQKVDQNFLMPLLTNLQPNEREAIREATFNLEAQCMRLVAHCLDKPIQFQEIREPVINTQYEEHLASWLPEHPFLSERAFRNVVFEGMALAVLIASDRPQAVQLGLEYLDSHKHNYHFVYFLHRIARGTKIPITCLQALLGSALEFVSTDAFVDITVESSEPPSAFGGSQAATVNTEIEIIMGADAQSSKTFQFQSEILDDVPIRLGGRLSSTYVSVHAEVQIGSSQEIELTTPVAVIASKLSLSAPSIILRSPSKQPAELRFALFEAETAESNVANIQTNGLDFVVAVNNRDGLTYPIVQFVQKAQRLPDDGQLREKYLRLKRILVQFRSHSRGTMARFKRKIENERVAGNKIGGAILNRLLGDQVLRLENAFYFLDPKQVDKHLGITWQDLQKGQTTDRLIQYLRSIQIS
jgi:hypothetical protein